MKIAIVFEVPDDQADTYAAVAARMIQHHAFAKQQQIKHWSFDVEMRPIAAVAVQVDEDFDRAAYTAQREMDQEHPWIPGAAFKYSGNLKPFLLSILGAFVPRHVASFDDAYAEAVREDWARGRVAAAGKSWATHFAKFDGTVLER